MGRLYWRERWSVLGCRRGWWRLVPFVAFVLIGYSALYGWLRATSRIYVEWNNSGPNRLKTLYGFDLDQEGYGALVWDNPATSQEPLSVDPGGKWPRSWTMKAMWPAVKLEVALDKLGWRWWPWGGITWVFSFTILNCNDCVDRVHKLHDEMVARKDSGGVIDCGCLPDNPSLPHGGDEDN